MPDLLARQAAPRIRWYVCGLLFFATTINYVDRQVLGLLKPVLEKELGWREADYGWIVFAFQLAYALMMPFAGRLIDWAGTRLGYAVFVALWSVAAMGHALARSAVGFGVARFALGLSESANFAASARWPQASSTAARISARFWPRWRSRIWRCTTAGARRSS
jgi:ACS family hexuronate transporter-like MFS transporter